MTDAAADGSARSEGYEGSAERTPETGEPAVDEALAGLDDLHRRPLSEHHDQLSRAHDALHDVLHDDPARPGTPESPR